AKSKEERRILNNEKLRLNKQIAMERRHLKEDGVQLRRELDADRQKLKENFQRSKKQLKNDVQQQKDELKQLKDELKRLENSKMIKDFFSFKKKYAKLIEEQERWVSKFYEDFSKTEIDSRWSDKQVISELLINGAPYSMIEDLHIFSSGNVQVAGGLLKIKIRQENKQGLAWDKTYGFVPKTFPYTSGILNSSHSFKQMYGKFEAKVRVKYTPGAYHAFWMGTESPKPHLNIFKFEGKNLVISAYAGDAKIERKLKYKLKDDFYIYTLLWSNNKLVWLINGKKVCESANIINEPMYISFSSGVYDKKAGQAAMYVDWVRCFRSN
ncbi:MAG: family 16 glycosylhydrolase, partial [Prevotellaceae bacterium]|nr:family 16 glycosylhydrolase [Prevotellaceae bacterium]